jgi:hypothetical protein
MSRSDDENTYEAFALHDLMERVRDYLAAGRRHANVSDGRLLGIWEDCYWSFLVYPSPASTERYESIDAERELRGLRAPEVRFSRSDRARIHRNIREAAANPEIRARIAADYEEFRRQWHGPGN